MKYSKKPTILRFSTQLFIALFSIAAIIFASLHLNTSAQAANLYLAGDTIFFDANANGVQDPGEEGIPNVVIELFDRDGNLVATTLTATAPIPGQYFFEVAPGKYTVRVAPENFAPGGALEGYLPTSDYDGNGIGETECTQWVIGEDNLTFDFGFWHPRADLSITKTDGVDAVDSGSPTTYTVRVTNLGPDPVSGANFLDTAGVGLTATGVVCSTAAGNQCVTAPVLADLLSGGITLPTLAPEQFYEVALTATVTATSGSVTNTATVTPPTDTTDPDLTNNTASDTDLVNPSAPLSADLSVTKNDGVTSVTSGSSTSYTVRVTNLGPDPVTGANFIDTAGVGLTATGVVCSTAAGNQCVTAPVLADLLSAGVTLPTLAPGQFYEVALTVTVTATSGSVTNTATVAPPSTISDPDLSNNTASDTDTIVTNLEVDLGVTKDDGVRLVDPNFVTMYTIRVTNLGVGPVAGARLSDDLGTFLTPLSVVCSTTPGNQCVSAPLLADLISTGGSALPTLSSGQFYEILVTARLANFPCAATNTTIVTLPGLIDSNPANNKATDTDLVTIPGAPSSEMAVTKTDGVDFVQPNSTTTYTIRVTNNGPDALEFSRLTDTVGAGLTATGVVCSTTPDNQCVNAPQLADLISSGILLPNLNYGQFYELLLTANVTAPSGTVTNRVNVSIPVGYADPILSNNTATDTDTIGTDQTPNTDLSVTKTDGVTLVNSNSSTTYAVRVTNNSSKTILGATLVDTPGAGLAAASVVCSTAAGNQCTTAPGLSGLTSTGISLPSLASGQFYEIEMTATVTADSGSVTNTATITTPTVSPDTNPGNNTASDTDAIGLFRYYLPMGYGNVPLPQITTWDLTVGYEDLSLVTGLNDFDYNDWAVAIEGFLTYQSSSSNLLKELTLSFSPRTRGGTYDHTFQVTFTAGTFDSNGTAVVNLYDANRNLINKQAFPFYKSMDNTFVIFARTSDVFPGSIVNTVEGGMSKPAQRYADFTLTFDAPVSFNNDPSKLIDPHGGGLFFDPELIVLNNNEQIHQGDSRFLNIPSNTWLWPEEGVRIDQAYPLVLYKPGTPPDFNFTTSWWTFNNNCVYNGVPCGNP
jgi:uncharacterized repeat protein (TIGR01451 family)